MKKLLAVLTGGIMLVILTQIVSAETMTALEAFESLLNADEAPLQQDRTADDYLDAIMAGSYDAVPPDALEAQRFAGDLDPLCRITNRDIAAYASFHDLKMAQVRNAYYKALANVLKTEIELFPASEEKYRSAQTILALFIDSDDEPTKKAVRAKMTLENSRRLATQYNLPGSFVEFVVMDANWNDTSWENDNDWRVAAGWRSNESAAFDGLVIGSRDAVGSTLIADMQSRLISLGFLKGKAVGVFGPRTQAALMEFQLANGYTADGAYTAEIYDALNDADAVARWDYSKDFWDTDELYDTTGEDTPDDPNTPEGDTPDAKDTPKTRKDTPDSDD